MRKIYSILLLWVFLSSLFSIGMPGGFYGIARAAEEWRLEFNELCGKTDEAATLSTDELGNLVERGGVLRKKIEQLGRERSTESKIFLKRLDMCLGLYDYMLRMKEKK